MSTCPSGCVARSARAGRQRANQLGHWYAGNRQSPSHLQIFEPVQLPQLPLQPSDPHCLPRQSGVQQAPSTHTEPPVHVQSLGQDEQVSPFPQLPSPQPTQAPAVHVKVPPHEPQLPPQPSDPHALPVQFGVQQASRLHTVPPVQLQSELHVPQFSLG